MYEIYLNEMLFPVAPEKITYKTRSRNNVIELINMEEISRMKTGGLAEYSDDVTVGTSAAVYIKSINPEKMKIKLVIVSCGKDVCQPSTPKYFIPDTLKHIRKWRYSPENSCKCIETVF